MQNPILNPVSREHLGEGFTAAEVALANRNSGLPLEMLCYDITPAGQHYLLSHFDIPYVADASSWKIEVGGLVSSPQSFSLTDLQKLPRVCERVMLECAGNGRSLVQPRWPSQPWGVEAVGNAEWAGCRLIDLLELIDLEPTATEIVFSGADQGVDGGVVHFFERSLTIEQIQSLEVVVAWEMNGQPLLPQHGFPVRLIVPGWFGMASVKWLSRITAIQHSFQGYQQVSTYRYRQDDADPGIPITYQKVRSLLIPPGIPDWSTRKRLVKACAHRISGRAWSGGGTPVDKVELAIDGKWVQAELAKHTNKYAWQHWSANCDIGMGKHELMCRATDRNGDTQPIAPVWDKSGMGNNAVHRVEVWGEETL